MSQLQHIIADCVFREQQPYTLTELCRARITSNNENGEADSSASRNGDTSMTALRDYLLSLRINKSVIFRQHANNTSGISMADTYQFDFVGLLCIRQFMFLVVPKYYRGIAPDVIRGHESYTLTEFSIILEAIRQYLKNPEHKNDAIGFGYEAAVDNDDGNLIDLYRFLLEDFAENGLYQSSRRITELNGLGEIDWNRTVNQIVPLRSSSRKPVYVDVVSTRSTVDTTTIVRSIQAAVITEISHYLESSGLNMLLHLPAAEPSPKSLSELGDNDQLLRLLWKELRVQFVTRKRLLLRALIQYLEKRSSGQRMPLLAQGTCSFNLVWEDACKVLFNDEESLHTTQPPQWDYLEPLEWDNDNNRGKKKSTHGDTISADETSEDDSDETQTTSSSPLEPDVVALNRDGSKRYIIDAKYYVPRYKPVTPSKRGEHKPKGKVDRTPGLKDIVKQYFYLLALMPQELKNTERSAAESDEAVNSPQHDGNVLSSIVAGNAFVMPGQIPLIPLDNDSQDDTNSIESTTREAERTTEPYVPPRERRKLLVRRGATYFPFMEQQLQTLYGEDVPSAIALFEMDPEQALRLYTEGNDHEAGLKRLTDMFGQ